MIREMTYLAPISGRNMTYLSVKNTAENGQFTYLSYLSLLFHPSCHDRYSGANGEKKKAYYTEF